MTVVVSDVVDVCTHFFGGTCTVLVHGNHYKILNDLFSITW